MSTLDLIRDIYTEHGTRNAYPATAEDLPRLAIMEPMAGPKDGAFLLRGCVSYERGEPLFTEVRRICGVLFLRLATLAEFTDT